MVCPPGRVKASDQPLSVDVPVLVMVMFSVRPLFHALTVSATRQAPPPGGGLEALGEPLGETLGEPLAEPLGETLGDVPPVRPKNSMAKLAMPVIGSECPAPDTEM